MCLKNGILYNEAPGFINPSNEELLSTLTAHYSAMVQTSAADPLKNIQTDNNDLEQLSLKQKLHVYLSNSEALEEYLMSHRYWTPNIQVDEFNPTSQRRKKLLKSSQPDRFINYLHVPKVMGKFPVPGLIHHTSAHVGTEVYTFGGLINLFSTKDSADIDVSKFHIKCRVRFPFPLDESILHYPSMIPNDSVYVLSSETDYSYKLEVTGDVPPPLICMSSSPITHRHIFYYGGFEFHDHVSFKDGEYFIDRDVELNNHGYILDIMTHKFEKRELVASPTVSTKFPVTVPRFGHTSTSVNIHKRLDPALAGWTVPATVFIMGGFQVDEKLKGRFKPIGDLWKVEFSINYRGKHNYLIFNDTVLATPISNSSQTTNFPLPRGFHVTELVDSKVLKPDSNIISNSKVTVPPEFIAPAINHKSKVGLARPASPESSSSQFSFDSEKLNRKLQLKLLVHGGSSKGDVLGDLWYFDLDDEVWTQQTTYFPNFDDGFAFRTEVFKCQVKRTGHFSALIDKYFWLFNGCSPDHFKGLSTQTDGIPDISPLALPLTRKDHDEVYMRVFVLNLSNNTWILPKVHHRVGQLYEDSPLSSMGSIGSTVTFSGSKFISIGGSLKPNLKNNPDMEGMKLMNSAMLVYENPLANFTNDQTKRV